MENNENEVLSRSQNTVLARYAKAFNVKKTNDFVYVANGYSSKQYIAVASRIPPTERYAILVSKNEENRIICIPYSNVTNIQQKLCQKLNESGTL